MTTYDRLTILLVAIGATAAVLLPKPQTVASPAPTPAPVIVGSPPGEIASLRTEIERLREHNAHLESQLANLQELGKQSAQTFPTSSPPRPPVVSQQRVSAGGCANGSCAVPQSYRPQVRSGPLRRIFGR